MRYARPRFQSTDRLALANVTANISVCEALRSLCQPWSMFECACATTKATIAVGASPDLGKKQLVPSCFKQIGLDVLRKEILKNNIKVQKF